ncbi:MAG: efflux RND transporter periplasmic adaptor subunit [Phycisphaeraceae bacterium]|nr:efflux RND transporter periplasmic adaptor subunit [Phycisphaeraceae bacterium]
MDRPTFSPFWHRVRAMRPRLRPHVQITRQHYRGRRWHVVHDPATNQFYRLNPIAHEFIGMLDGRRSVEDVWKISLERHADAAPTQNEVIQLLSQMYQSNLLSGDVPPETEQLLQRGTRRRKQKAIQQAIGLMYFRIRLFNPDAFLAWIEPILRPILNRWGFLLWLALMVFTGSQLLPHWERLSGGFEDAIAPSNWGWMFAMFVLAKAIHETGHGVICKRFGGQVPELGFMLLVLIPAPYVDASAAWAFESKWKRISVGAGGMIFELGLACLAALVWLNSAEGQLVHQLSYNLMLTASISTILFNANPLMKFDGYYILSDLIEVPNLMQRSQQMLQHLAKKYLYRLKNETPPTTQPGERVTLVVYGILAMAYRIFLFISITTYVLGLLFGLGVMLAIWTGTMWFILPAGKFVHWLASHQSLSEHRFRAVATSVALGALVLVAIGVVPVQDRRRASGVVVSLTDPGVFAGADGFIAAAHVVPGDWVRAGDPIVTLENPEYEARLELHRASIREAEILERRATVQSPVQADVVRQRIEALRRQEAYLQERMSRLVVRAPHDGFVVGLDPATILGSWAAEGQGVCQIVDTSNLRVVANLGQAEAAWHFDLGRENYDIEMRVYSDPFRVWNGGQTLVLPAGQYQLRHPALGFSGGGTVQTDPQDRSGTQTRRPQFTMEVSPVIESESDEEAWAAVPGQRVAMRFTLPSQPLLLQWIDRLHKLIQGRPQV